MQPNKSAQTCDAYRTITLNTSLTLPSASTRHEDKRSCPTLQYRSCPSPRHSTRFSTCCFSPPPTLTGAETKSPACAEHSLLVPSSCDDTVRQTRPDYTLAPDGRGKETKNNTTLQSLLRPPNEATYRNHVDAPVPFTKPPAFTCSLQPINGFVLLQGYVYTMKASEKQVGTVSVEGFAAYCTSFFVSC